MQAKVNESPSIKSKMDDVAEAVAAVKRDLIGGLPKMRRAVRILRIGPGSVMNAISRMSPPHPGHATGNSAPTRTMRFTQSESELLLEADRESDGG
jgi:hypothetical protein